MHGAKAEPPERAHEESENEEAPFAVPPDPEERAEERWEHDRRLHEHAPVGSGQQQFNQLALWAGTARDELLGEAVEPVERVVGWSAAAG